MSKYYKSLILSILIITITLLVVYVLDRVVGNKFNKIYAGWNKEGYRGEIKKNKKKKLIQNNSCRWKHNFWIWYKI